MTKTPTQTRRGMPAPIPETCGVCKLWSGDGCAHPDTRRVVLVVAPDEPPPLICPIRRAAEICEAEERGARWALTAACRAALRAPNAVTGLKAVEICAEART